MKITTSGSRRYVQLVESYRDDAGKVKKRTVATLGRLDQVDSQLNAVFQGLMKVSGQVPTPTPMISSPSIAFEAARAFGDVWALTELWKELGFSALRQVFRKTRHTTDVEALIRVMVLNRLCDPESKLGVLRWVETVALPDFTVTTITHDRIRAHAAICFMALILHRVMRSRLRASHTGLTPERALEQLHRIQHHRVRLNGAPPVSGASSIPECQSEVLHALRVKKPTASQQLTLL